MAGEIGPGSLPVPRYWSRPPDGMGTDVNTTTTTWPNEDRAKDVCSGECINFARCNTSLPVPCSYDVLDAYKSRACCCYCQPDPGVQIRFDDAPRTRCSRGH